MLSGCFAKRDDLDFVSAITLVDDLTDSAIDFRDASLAFWIAGLNKLLDTWETLGDIGRSHTTGVEDSHGELGTRFTDGLSGHDTNGLAEFDKVAGSHVKTIAVLANAILGLAGEERTDLDFGDAFFDDSLGVFFADEGVALHKDLTGLWRDDVMHGVTSDKTVLEFDEDDVFGGVFDLTDLETVVAMAIFLTDDDVLSDVDETSSEITRVSGLKSGVGTTLAGTVGIVEVFGDG